MADTSAYPGVLDGDLRAVVPSGLTPVALLQALQLVADAVAKIETELGTNPSGAETDVAAAIAAAAATGSALTFGGLVYRYQDVGSAVPIPTGSGGVVVTESLMDGQDVEGVAPAVWSDANDRFDITADGWYLLTAELNIDLSSAAAGTVQPYLSVSNNGTYPSNIPVHIRGPEMPAGFYYKQPQLEGVRFLPAGSRVQLLVKHSGLDVAGSLVYADVAMRQIA